MAKGEQVSRLLCVLWWHRLIIKVLELLPYLSMQSVQNVHHHCLICVSQRNESKPQKTGDSST